MFLEERSTVALASAEAERLTRDLYGLTVTAAGLPGEYDSNFLLRGSDGSQFVLKCMHPARDASFIEMQCAALEHLAARAPHLTLPRVQLTKQGKPFTEISDAAEQKRLVWMLSYLPRATFAKTHPHAPELLRDLGRFLGQMDQAFQTFSHPAAFRGLKWDAARAGW